MQKPSPLQICFGISILLHVALFSAMGILGYFPARPAHQSQGDFITLTVVATPDEPAAPPPAVKAVAPVQPLTAEKPVENPAPTESPKQPVRPEPQQVIAVPPPVQFAVAPQQMPPTDFHDDIPPARPTQPDSAVKPDYLKNPEPVYPEQARRRHQEGLVLLAVTVTAQGRTGRVEIKKSSGFPLLDNAAVQAVRDWEFQPARLNSLALESEIEVPVRFELRKP
ncbi:MAG TPA: TonB family protein [Verrucomicrobiae bacterium]|jgi:protein TonB|nr:TonB family protein [Verrucomicrobiae bacterium]